MLLWRISNYATLDGQGGLLASARWHTRGRPVVYLAATPAGALVEALVHLELGIDELPQTYKLLKAECPDNIGMLAADEALLPDDWRSKELVTRSMGDEWLAQQRSALLSVPSAILPETSNLLLNPGHPDAAQVRVVWHRAFRYDPRFPTPSGSLPYSA
jgi:RES domain-containing protein